MLDILAQVPDVPLSVLRVEGQLGFVQYVIVVVAVPPDGDADTRDRLGQIRRDELDLAVDGVPFVVERSAFPDVMRTGLEREPRIVHLGRISTEVRRIEAVLINGVRRRVNGVSERVRTRGAHLRRRVASRSRPGLALARGECEQRDQQHHGEDTELHLDHSGALVTMESLLHPALHDPVLPTRSFPLPDRCLSHAREAAVGGHRRPR
jgi:hypothetical protein